MAPGRGGISVLGTQSASGKISASPSRSILGLNSFIGDATEPFPVARSKHALSKRTNLMNWEAVIAVVEVVGLVAIVGSLLYVGVQTRQANDHATAASTIAWVDGWNRALSGLADDEATSAAMRKGFRSFNTLSKHEQALFHVRVGAIVNQ